MKRISATAAVITGLFASVTLANDTPKAVHDHIAAHKDKHGALAELICAQAKRHKYVFLGDTYHGSTRIRDAVFSPKVLKAIKDCVPSRALVLEGPPTQKAEEKEQADLYLKTVRSYQKRQKENQRLEKRLQDDSLSGEGREFIESLLRFGNRLQKIMKPKLDDLALRHFLLPRFSVASAYYDQGYNLTVDERKTMRVLSSSYVRDRNCSNITLLYNAQSMTADPRQFFIDLNQLLKKRLANDNAPVADSVLTNHPKGAVVFYGSAHMSYRNDLDEMLGTEDSVTINIVDTSKSAVHTEGTFMTKLADVAGDRPDHPEFIYDAVKQTYEAVHERHPYVQKKRSRVTEEKFNECRAALPQSVRRAFTEKTGQDFTYRDFRVFVDPKRGLPQIIEHWAP